LGYKSGLVATKLFNDYLKKFKPKEFDEVKVFYGYGNGPGFFHTKKPVSKLEDLKGMKIRCTGLGTKIVSALGGTPVAMVLAETYDALSRGVVEGVLVPFDAIGGWKLAEVVKYHTIGYGSSFTSSQIVVMNKDKWKALPPDLQKIIEDVNEEWIEKEGRAHDAMDQFGKNMAVKLGNKMIYLSKEEDERWAKAVKPLYNEYVKNMKAKGLPGAEVLKFCLDRLKTLQ
jgi:TRAP-type C4-dicarboxylate transport system substrate-binding protein